MNLPRTQTLVLLGVLFGLITGGIVMAVTFDSGDAVKTTGPVIYENPDGLEVTFEGSANITSENLFPTSDSIRLNTSKGNITINATSSASATIYASNLTGTWTNVTDITAGATWINISAADKQRVDVRGDADNVSIKSMTLSDGNVDFRYGGPNSGTATLRIYDLPADTKIAATDAADGSLLDTARSDANGVATFDLPTSSHNVQLLDKDTNNTPFYEDAEPQGLISGTPPEINVTVKDGDMPSDEIEVNISLDGSQIHSENITSNATVSTSNFGTLDLGQHQFTVNSTDAYGNFNSTVYNFSLPQNITIRNESNASQVIKDKNITATFYGVAGETIVERSDSNGDGNISLRNLPDTSFVVTFEGPGWYDRRAYIDSIGNQQNIYLLNSTAYDTARDEAIETTFVYEDRTNQFGQSNTTLQIERGLDPDNDGNFTWQTVAGDYWGAAGEFPFTGQYQTRYRLVITNQQTGQRRILGTHIPTSDGVKNIIVGRIIFSADNATGRYWDAGINQTQQDLQIYYNDPTNKTTDLNILVYEQGNKSNVLYNTTISGPVGEVIRFASLSESQTDTNWIVQFDGQHSEDGRVYGELIVGGSDYPLPIDGDYLTSFGVIMITFVMALYGPRVATMGAWAGALFYTGLIFLGWLTMPMVSVVVPFLIAGAGTFYSEAMPS